MKRMLTMAMILVSVTHLWGAAKSAEVLLVDNKVSVLPISVDKNAPKETMDAAKELAGYIQKISGGKVDIILNDSTNTPAHAIWVGVQPKLENLFPDLKIDYQYPEEILIVIAGKDIVIAGRDKMTGTAQTEFGTANAVYTFLQKYLDVRWLWPGPLGEDVIRKDTISLPSSEYRFHPPLRMRKIWRSQLGKDTNLQLSAWFRFQRLELDSAKFSAGHSFTDWWDKYHETHPDWFALREDNTRTPEKWGMEVKPKAVKLCVSNPEVAAQWLKNAEELLLKEPTCSMIGATPNDGGGFCTCKNCRVWDNPNGPPVWGYVALTDRYVKFWNILARGLKERFPDRNLYVGAYAYSAYTTPPVSESLEKNIAVAQVGHFPLTTDASRQEQKEQWRKWAEKVTMMWYRPNLWYWCGGIWGFPEVAMKKTIEDFRFLAENRCEGLEVDGYRGYWATQGPEYYVMAQVTYDPFQDGQAMLRDYYLRGFGPAAGEVEQYWNLMEDARDAIVRAPEFKIGSGNRYGLPAVFQQVYTDSFLNRESELLQQAARKLEGGPEIYRKRVEFVCYGLDYLRLMMDNISVMAKVRKSKGQDVQAVKKAVENWEAIEQLSKLAGPIAFNSYKNLITWTTGTAYMGGMQDFFGPPSENMRKGAYTVPEKLPDGRGQE